MWKISHHKSVVIVEKKIAICTCDMCGKISESIEYTCPSDIYTRSCILCKKHLCKDCNIIIGDSQCSQDNYTSWWDDCLLDTCSTCKNIIQKLWEHSDVTAYDYDEDDAADRDFYYNHQFNIRYNWILDKLEDNKYIDYI